MFEDKPIDDELKMHKLKREKLCQERLAAAYCNKTPSWTVEDVEYAITYLNNEVSKEPYGHPNELFKPGVAGKDLVNAVTKLMNILKDNPQAYPSSMSICNVTNIYKNKGDINNFDSYRGVFRTTVLRNVRIAIKELR